MEYFMNAMPLLLIMAIFWIGWALHSVKIQRIDKSVDQLKESMDFILYYLQQKDPQFYNELQLYLDYYLKDEEW